MVQLYSSGLTVAAGAAFPLNNVIYSKGSTVTHGAPVTTELNQRGVYRVHCDAYGTLVTAGEFTIQLSRDGVPMVGGISSTSVAAGDVGSVSFECLVVVPQTNCPCNCTSAPVTIQVNNASEVEVTDAYINVIVTKLC